MAIRIWRGKVSVLQTAKKSSNCVSLIFNIGFQQRRPLMSKQVFEDISTDYVKKTVTIEAHPHLNMNLASIHPCKHADVMKKVIERMGESAHDQESDLRVDQ